MSDPLSHLAAVIGAIAFFVVGIMTYVGLNDPSRWRSPGWTTTFLVAATIVIGSAVTYFRPTSRIALIPVLAAVLLSSFLLAWNLVIAVRWYLDDPNTCYFGHLYRSALVFVVCLPWALGHFRHLRRSRSQ